MPNAKRVRWVALLGGAALAGCGGDRLPTSPAESHEPHPHATGAAAKDDGPSPSPADLGKIAPSADYPLKTCVVSGEPLDGMGGPLAFEYGGTEVQFCCDGCIKEFRKDPERYLEKVRAAKR